MARRLAVEIIGDSSSLERAFKRSAGSAQKFNGEIGKAGKGKMFGGLTKAAGLATGALGVGGLASAAKLAFGEMADAQKVGAQTAAVIKSTGGAANVTSKHMETLAGSLMKVSGTDDEAIQSGENMLATFTNIKNGVGKNNQIFDQATKATLDLSTSMKKDMGSSAVLVGKALNDPVKGLTALQRVGVTFTDSQKDAIKAMVKTGDTAGAQRVILKELNTEFGGSAEAAGKTLPGKLNLLKESLSNVGGSIAEQLTPQLTTLATSMGTWLTDSQNQKAILDTVKGVTDALSSAVGFLKGAFDLLSGAVGGNKNAIKLLIAMYATWKVATFAGKIADLAGKFGLLSRKQDAARGSAGKLKGSLAGKVSLAAAAGVASYELTTMALKATHLDKKLHDLGGTAFDVAANLGLVKDPMAKFEGKVTPSQRQIGVMRQTAAVLESRGLNPGQAAAAIRRVHPTADPRSIEVAAGVYGKPPQLTIHGGLHVTGVQNVRALEEEIAKRTRQRPHRRRGT